MNISPGSQPPPFPALQPPSRDSPTPNQPTPGPLDGGPPARNGHQPCAQATPHRNTFHNPLGRPQNASRPPSGHYDPTGRPTGHPIRHTRHCPECRAGSPSSPLGASLMPIRRAMPRTPVDTQQSAAILPDQSGSQPPRATHGRARRLAPTTLSRQPPPCRPHPLEVHQCQPPAGSSPPPTLVRTRTPSTTHLAAPLRASQPNLGPSHCPHLEARSEALPAQQTIQKLPSSQPIPFPAANTAGPAASRPRRQRLAPACEHTLSSTGRHPSAGPTPSPRWLPPTRDRHSLRPLPPATRPGRRSRTRPGFRCESDRGPLPATVQLRPSSSRSQCHTATSGAQVQHRRPDVAAAPLLRPAPVAD